MGSSSGRANRPRWRAHGILVSAVIGAAVGLLLFGGAFAAFAPWLAEGVSGPPDKPYADPTAHRWHDAQHTAVAGILFGVSFVALLRRPERKPAVMQFIVVLTALTIILVFIIGMYSSAIIAVPVVLAVWLYPDRSKLLRLERPANLNLAILAIAVLAALLMAPDAIDTTRLQFMNIPGDEHGEHGHWISSLLNLLAFLAAGILASLRLPGWRTLKLIAGAAYLYLGIVALTSHGYRNGIDPPGIWSTAGGAMAILAGIGYFAVPMLEDRLGALVPRLVGYPRAAN